MRGTLLVTLALASSIGAAYAIPSMEPIDPDVTVCVMAAAASDRVQLKDVDQDDCKCATKQLHQLLKPSDYALHEQMVEIIASGADEKSFNKQMSDIMLKRGMNQGDVDKFLAKSKTAEQKARDICDPSPLLTPETPSKFGH